jgi:ribosome-binding factor A
MFLTILKILLIVVGAYLLPIGISFFIGNIVGQKQGIKKAMQIPVGAFEPHLLEGLSIFNNYLETSFLKYVHNLLIQLGAHDQLMIKAFLNNSVSESDMDHRLAAFLTLVTVQMSQDLKKLFYRYYNWLDDDRTQSNTFNSYVSEWFILRIRKLEAEYTTLLGSDMSTKNAIAANSKMFVMIETDLYVRLGMLVMPQLENRNK